MGCFMCKGHMEKQLVNYILDLNKMIIIVKGTPAKVCTQCGEQFFEDNVAMNLEKIVNSLRDLDTEVIIANYNEKVVA